MIVPIHSVLTRSSETENSVKLGPATSAFQLLPLHQNTVCYPAEASAAQTEFLDSSPRLNVDGPHFSLRVATSDIQQPQKHTSEDQHRRRSRSIRHDQIRKALPSPDEQFRTLPTAVQARYRTRPQRLIDLPCPWHRDDFVSPAIGATFRADFFFKVLGAGGGYAIS